MHELSLCGAIAGIVTPARRRPFRTHDPSPRRAVASGGSRHARLLLSLVSEGTALAGSRIAVESVPARLSCTACDGTVDIGPPPVFACPSCDRARVEVVAGEEFLITSLDLAEVWTMGRVHRHDDGTVHEHDDNHSAYETGVERVEVLERIFDENDRCAAANRKDFAAHGVNLMSSPGAG